jgi:hypothetical protein
LDKAAGIGLAALAGRRIFGTMATPLEQFARVRGDLEDHCEATRIEWLRATRQGFHSIEEKNAFFTAINASSERLRELLELKWKLEREIDAKAP